MIDWTWTCLRATDRSLDATFGTNALALARCAKDSTIGAWAMSRESGEPSAAGTSCIWSKYARHFSGTEPGLSR